MRHRAHLNPAVLCGRGRSPQPHCCSCCNWRLSDGHLKNRAAASPAICPPNAQEKLSLMEMLREGDEKVEEGGKKTALVAKWVHLLITMAVAVFPAVVGTHESFRSSEGASKASETGHSVSYDPIRVQWSMGPAKKRPERERSHLMLLASRSPPHPPLPLPARGLLTARAITTTSAAAPPPRSSAALQDTLALRRASASSSLTWLSCQSST